MLIDTHAHLDFPEFINNLPSVLDRAGKAGVKEIISIGIDVPSSRRAIEIARTYPNVYATVGIHPHGAGELDAEAVNTLRTLAREDRVVAMGEIGLDYFRDRQPRPVQRACFSRQLELASELALPVVFHIRDAFDDFMGIMREYAPSLKGGILHCFSGDWKIAEECLGLGFYVSIPGTVTFPKSEVQQDVVRRAPLDRLLVETDAPFLAPVPYRGKDNEPAFVLYTAKKIAELRACPLEEVARQTTANAHRVFGIKAEGAKEAV